MPTSNSPIPIRYIRVVQIIVTLLGVFTLIDFIKTPNADNAIMLAGEILVIILGFQAIRKLEQGNDKK